MIRLIFTVALIFAIGFALFFIADCIIKGFKSAKYNYLQQSEGNLKPNKTELDYWYEKPHYFVFPDGKMINLSEYMTYEEYKSYSKEKIMQIAYHIYHNLYDNNTTIDNNSNNEVTL